MEITENWEVIGLRGTGSHDLVVDGAVVPEERTFVRGGARTVDEPLYRYPTVPHASQVLAVVGLGVARAALDHVIAQGGRSGCTGAPKPAERSTYRIAVGQADAQLRSARAFFYEATEEAWTTVQGGGRPRDRRSGEHAAPRPGRLPTRRHRRRRRRQPPPAPPSS